MKLALTKFNIMNLELVLLNHNKSYTTKVKLPGTNPNGTYFAIHHVAAKQYCNK